MFSLDYAGPGSFDVRTRRGSFCGVISPRKDGTYRVWFNMNATKGSARKFDSIQSAVEYIYARRIKKGWGV